MARIYSRRKGKSASKKPSRQENPKWVKQTEAEIKRIVIQLAEKGKSPAMIGTILRDSYGIPDVKLATKKNLLTLMKEKDIAPKLPQDISDLMNKATVLQKHLLLNKTDNSAKRGMEITKSKIRRLAKYYKGKGILPKDWKYSITEKDMRMTR